MFVASSLKQYVGLWIFVVFFSASNVESQSTNLPSVSCSSSQSLCGGSICYDPATQYCTELGIVVQCIGACGSQCYNPSTQQCFNGTVCRLSEQLCVVKYESAYSYQYDPPLYQCYNPTYRGCFNNSLCDHPSRSCNRQCLQYNQVCANNVTACNVTDLYWKYLNDQIKLCNGVCYDSAIQECINGTIQCINNCSGVCYNSSSQQCFNGTVCRLGEQLCVVKYESGYGYSRCDQPSRSCNGQCLQYKQVCVNNVTVCNVTDWYWNYLNDQIKLCNGLCYDSAIQLCVNGTIQCINNCSGVCYNSSSQQCFNGTVCRLSEQLCVVKYESGYGYQYNPPLYQCYNPTYQDCFNNSLCDHPSQSCNQQCLGYNQVCVNNVTVCNVTGWYWDYLKDQIKLCNGVCYDSAIQLCVGGHTTYCIRDPSTRECINQSTHYSQFPNATSILTSTLSLITTRTSTTSSSYCSVKKCIKDADCCIQSAECQCFRPINQNYGSCLNPYKQPICANGCPVQKRCSNNTDCCKCRCGQVKVTNTNGNLVTKSQCVPR